MIGPGAEWGRSLSSLSPCTALRLSAEEVCTSLLTGGPTWLLGWRSCGGPVLDVRPICFRSPGATIQIPSALVQPCPSEAWKRPLSPPPLPPAPTRLLAASTSGGSHAEAALRNQRYCIHYLRLKAGPRQAPAADAYGKCGSLLSAAQSSEAGTARVLDEAHLEKIKSIVSLSSP